MENYVSPRRLGLAVTRLKAMIAEKLSASGVVNNDTTTVAGYVADARIVKVHGDEIDQIRQSFTDGCNTLVAGCTSKGATPASNSPADIVAAINKIWTDRYNSGFNAGKASVVPAKLIFAWMGWNCAGSDTTWGTIQTNYSYGDTGMVSVANHAITLKQAGTYVVRMSSYGAQSSATDKGWGAIRLRRTRGSTTGTVAESTAASGHSTATAEFTGNVGDVLWFEGKRRYGDDFSAFIYKKS